MFLSHRQLVDSAKEQTGGDEAENDEQKVTCAGGRAGPGREQIGGCVIAKLEGTKAHLLLVLTVRVSLALAVIHLVLGGATTTHYGSLCKYKKRERKE